MQDGKDHNNPAIENRRVLFLSIADRRMQTTGGIRLADCKTRLGCVMQERWLQKILRDNYDYEPPIIPELNTAD